MAMAFGLRYAPSQPAGPQDSASAEAHCLKPLKRKTHQRHSWSQPEASVSTKVRTRSRSIAIRCKPSSVRTSPPKTSLA
jgi:hypothetical protein